jgi:hypothetical protein
MQADAKGLKYALAVLKEEMAFHTNATVSEIAQLEEKLERETAALKPSVEKAVKKLAQKQDKTLTVMQRSFDRKAAALEKRHERALRKLQAAEAKTDAVQRKMDSAKKRKTRSRSSSGSFALKKYEKEIWLRKKEVKAVSDELEKLENDFNGAFKQKKEAFQSAIAQEEKIGRAHV